MRTYKYYECGICGHLHPWEWDGDCRDDDNRFTYQDIWPDGGEEYETVGTMSERVAADVA